MHVSSQIKHISSKKRVTKISTGGGDPDEPADASPV